MSAMRAKAGDFCAHGGTESLELNGSRDTLEGDSPDAADDAGGNLPSAAGFLHDITEAAPLPRSTVDDTPSPAAPETPTGDLAAPEIVRRDGRPLLYAGLGLIALSIILSWWSLTKYRVYELRGVDMANAGEMSAVEGQKSGESDEKYAARMKEYHERRDRYRRAWDVNVKQYGEFYNAYLGEKYLQDLSFQDVRSKSTGKVYFRGWSTWTGWFGMVFIVVVVGLLLAPKFAPQFEPWEWTFPWVGAGLLGLFTLMAVSFFLTVPDENDDGYSQGVSWGNYIAIVGGGLATAGCVFEGLRAADKRLADIQSGRFDTDDDKEDDDDDPPPVKPAAPLPSKNRLQDW